jgi:HEPN domain-containing protein
MRDPERLTELVREWVEKAENDLVAAVHTLTLRERCPSDMVCFHAQQCVEKYLKAYLVFASIDFPKTHDVERLVALLPRGVEVSLSAEQQRRLTEHATVLRYPGNYPPIVHAEARKTVALARRVRREVRAHLPKAALRRRRK